MPATDNRCAAPLDAHLGYWLRFVSNHVSGRFQQKLEQQGVTVTEWVALRTLWGRGETRHGDLVEALGMTKGAASKVVSRLEGKGLVLRQFAGANPRDQSLALTAAGRSLVPRLAAVADENDEHFFGHLERRQRRALMAAMQGLVRHHRLRSVPTT